MSSVGLTNQALVAAEVVQTPEPISRELQDHLTAVFKRSRVGSAGGSAHGWVAIETVPSSYVTCGSRREQIHAICNTTGLVQEIAGIIHTYVSVIEATFGRFNTFLASSTTFFTNCSDPAIDTHQNREKTTRQFQLALECCWQEESDNQSKNDRKMGPLFLEIEILRMGKPYNWDCQLLINRAYQCQHFLPLEESAQDVRRSVGWNPSFDIPAQAIEEDRQRIIAMNQTKAMYLSQLASYYDARRLKNLANNLYPLYQKIDRLIGLGPDHPEFQTFDRQNYSSKFERVSLIRQATGIDKAVASIIQAYAYPLDNVVRYASVALTEFNSYFTWIMDTFSYGPHEDLSKENPHWAQCEAYYKEVEKCLVPVADGKKSHTNETCSIIYLEICKIAKAHRWNLDFVYDHIKNWASMQKPGKGFNALKKICGDTWVIENCPRHLQDNFSSFYSATKSRLLQLQNLMQLEFQLTHEYRFYQMLQKLVALGVEHPAYQEFNRDVHAFNDMHSSGQLDAATRKVFERWKICSRWPTFAPIDRDTFILVDPAEWVWGYIKAAMPKTTPQKSSQGGSAGQPAVRSLMAPIASIDPIEGSIALGLRTFFKRQCQSYPEHVVAEQMWDYTKKQAHRLMQIHCSPDFDIEYIVTNLTYCITKSYFETSCDRVKSLNSMIAFIGSVENLLRLKTDANLPNLALRIEKVNQVFRYLNEMVVEIQHELNTVREETSKGFHFNMCGGNVSCFTWMRNFPVPAQYRVHWQANDAWQLRGYHHLEYFDYGVIYFLNMHYKNIRKAVMNNSEIAIQNTTRLPPELVFQISEYVKFPVDCDVGGGTLISCVIS